MSDLVFNIENIFSSEQRNGVLGQNDVSKYYIPPYQRGYKWKSEGQNAWVKILMYDLLDSFDNNETEYYLQYITVKKRIYNEEKVLELIDGQQRITTLIILLSAISQRIESPNQTKSIVHNKLIYGTRDKVHEFLNDFIYCNINSLSDNSWEEFITEFPDFDEQDIYYIFKAVQKINELLPTENDKLIDFYRFVKENVKLILNLVEEKISSEKIFSNLNSNKVELTSTELIKGLLLTKSARKNTSDKQDYKELLELRAMMGRQWDEIARWVNREDIKSFYFPNNTNAMEQFLTMIAWEDGYSSTIIPDKYHLFDFFQTRIKRKVNTALYYFNKIKLFYSLMKDWYADNEIYNRLGFLFFAKTSLFKRKSIIDFFEKDKSLFKKDLLILVIEQIPDDISDLEYGTDNDIIHKVLLSINVLLNEKDYRFNFHSFQEEEWSLEHIFPQNPEKLSNNLGKKDIDFLNSLVKIDQNEIDFSKYLKDEESISDLETMCDSIFQKLKKEYCKISDREKDLLYQFIRTEKLNSIGNMALLASSDNSSNNNGMFDYKRMNIVSRVSNGSFVPKHTYDVFSKLISKDFNPDLTIWNERDINAHARWISEKIQLIKKMVE